jgi:hypothetical protein
MRISRIRRRIRRIPQWDRILQRFIGIFRSCLIIIRNVSLHDTSIAAAGKSNECGRLARVRAARKNYAQFVWAFNTTDAVLLSWCSVLKKDSAYTILNVFWIGVGVVGMFRAVGFTLH